MDFVLLLLEVNFVWMYIGFGVGLLLVVVGGWDLLVVELVIIVEVYGLVLFGLVVLYWCGLVVELMVVMVVFYIGWLYMIVEKI